MAAATTLTWDINPPRVPSLEDVGGALLQDDPTAPPDKASMPYADSLNQVQLQIAASAKTTDKAIIEVIFDGGDPVVNSATAPGTNVAKENFIPIDNGDGDTTISWDASVLPPIALAPIIQLNDDVAALAPIAIWLSATSFQVKTRNAASSLTDIAFTAVIK